MLPPKAYAGYTFIPSYYHFRKEVSLMNKKLTILGAVAILACVVVLNGCSRTMKLVYSKPSFGEMDRGKIHVVLKDERAPKRGGNEPTRVGTLRGGFGNPFAVWSRVDREPVKVVRELISDSLMAAGYKVVDQPEGVPKIYATLQEFWCDGYAGYKMTLKVPMDLKQGENSAPVWNYSLNSKGRVFVQWGPGDLNKGYKRMLEDAVQQLTAQFQSPGFHNSYRSISKR